MAAIDAADLYRRLGPRVLGYLRARGAHDPEDVLGEVFLQVARDAARFKGEGAEAQRRWVFTIARNRLVDEARRRQRRPAESPLPDGDSSEVVGGTQTGPALPDPDLVAALARLTDEQREVVALRFVADLPLVEVAELTASNVNAVKQLQHRALLALRVQLGVVSEKSGPEA